MASRSNRSTRRLELPVLREIAAWIERELFANIGVRTGLVWRGERQHYMRQNVNRPFDAFTVPVSISDPGPDGRVGTSDDGPAIPGYDLRPESLGSGAHQHRPQCARRRQPSLDVGDHGDQALHRAVVAGGRLRAHLEPRPGERILRSVRPQQRLSADAERPDQCRQGWAVRVQDLVGQDSRHVRRAVGCTDHAVSAPSVRPALRAHVLDGTEATPATSGFSPSRSARAAWTTSRFSMCA